MAEAHVCVVENSVIDWLIPVDDVTIQQTVTECEVGMRSGRYEAIAADDLQLAGVLMDRNLGSNYELLSWSDVADNEAANVAEELLESYQYWIGTDPSRCDALAEALRTVLNREPLMKHFLIGKKPPVCSLLSRQPVTSRPSTVCHSLVND